MTKILVTGGTGALGWEIVARLAHLNSTVRILSRRSPEQHGMPLLPDTQWVKGDLKTGEGIAEAVADTDILIHAATYPRSDRESGRGGTQLLLEKACEAGISHLVYISIIGIDRIPFVYYRAKLVDEELIQHSGIPWSILRAAQFHYLIDAFIQTGTMLPPFAFLPTDLKAQPIDTSEVAERLVEIAVTGPGGRVSDLAGPQVLTLGEMLQGWLNVRQMHRVIIPIWIPGRVAAGFRAGYNTAPSEPRRGTITWDSWLRTHYQSK